MVAASNACRARHEVPRPRGDAADFVAAVRRAIGDGGYDIVFGGADDWMAALAAARDELPTAVASPSRATVDAALDKLGLTRRAAAVGLASPVTVLATADTVASWTGPVVVKCRSHWFAGVRRGHRIEARRFDDVGAALHRIRTIRAAGFEAVLQQPIDGQLGALVGLFHDGRLRGRVQQIAPRLWPTPSGVSSRALTVPVDEVLARRCEDLLAGLGWTGLVELQFLLDDDGRPHLIDLNGRFYGSMALAIAAGPNLPDAWARQVVGAPLPPLPDARPGVRYVWTAGDLRRAVTERRGGLVGDVLSTVRWRHGAATSIWERTDPGPLLDLIVSKCRRVTPRGDDR